MNLESIKILKNIPEISNNKLLSKKTLATFYSQLNNALESWESQYEEDALNITIKYHENKYNEIYDYNYIKHEIRKKIEANGSYCTTFDIHIEKNHYNILLCFPSKETNNVININKIKKHFFNSLFKMYLWLYIVQDHKRKQCGCKSNINIIFSNEKKMVHGKGILDTIHANSAFTTSCKEEINICVYRYEEWFKVFIHETFHSFGMDFSHFNNNIAESLLFKMFQVENKDGIRVYESYCECWAEIINIVIISFLQVDNKKEHASQFYRQIKKEIQFSTFQLVKVLDNYNIDYETLIDNSYKIIKFKEHTSILSYYIIKLILLYNCNDFEKWCKENNNTLLQFKKEENIINFVDFIKSIYKKPDLLTYIKKVQKFILKKKLNEELKCTMRMTVIEF